MHSDAARLWDLIEHQPTCMMTTVDQAGTPHARPMRAIPERDHGLIWLYTELASGKSRELAEDGSVCLAFADPNKSEYVSVSGRAGVTQDRAKIHEHWSRFVDAWFPDGPDGPNVAMIRMEPEIGEYWDGQSSSVLRALKMLTASERDTVPDLGENKKVGSI